MTQPPPPDQAQTNVLDAPPPAGGPEPEPSRRLGWGLAIGALVLVAVAGAAVAAYFAGRGGSHSPAASTAAVTTAPTATVQAVLPPNRVVVPDVTGLQEDKAAARLGAAHLTPKVRTKATPKPTGIVVAQRPLAGKQSKKDGTVTIVVDRGAPAVAVPDLTGVKVADAGARLAKAGLKAKTTQVTTTDRPPGTVVSQAPAAGAKLKRGSVVTLSIARRPPRAVTTTAAATTTTTAPATTTAPRTTTTTAAAPAHPSTASVPDVSGRVLADAADALAQAGLYPNVVYVPGSDPLGTVEQQAKPAGTTVPWGSYVRVNVSKGPKPPPDASVPDVTQQPRAQAMQSLGSGGFETKVLWKQVASNVKADVVLDEQPAPGNPAPKGALVILIVSKR